MGEFEKFKDMWELPPELESEPEYEPKYIEKIYHFFISHAKEDTIIVSYFVDLLYSVGLKENDMFYSSIPEIGISVKENIYDYLQNILDSKYIITLFFLSKNHYNIVHL